jgi:hypothetical protein
MWRLRQIKERPGSSDQDEGRREYHHDFAASRNGIAERQLAGRAGSKQTHANFPAAKESA